MSVAPAPLPHVWPTVVHMLADAYQRSPRATALICGDEKLNYTEYAACVSGLANELSTRGVGKGDRVALVMGNSIDIAIATLGVQACGAQVVPLNPAYTTSELVPVLEDADCIVVIFDEVAAGTLRPLFKDHDAHRTMEVSPANSMRLTRWRDDHALANCLPLPDAQSLSTLQYTGGTTGRSKGVQLSHRAVSTNVSQREALLPTKPDDERILVVTPLFHSYAVSTGLYLSIYCRGTLVIMPRYKPEFALDAIVRHTITLLLGSPTLFVSLMAFEDFGAADLSSLRLCYSGSSALSAETLRRWEAATGCSVCEGYGQSEAGPVLTFNPRYGRRKLGSVGIVVPQTELQIVDVATGSQLLDAGEPGEIRVRGPQVMEGYRGLEQETATALRGSWLYTGDIGELDTDGYLYIRDRKKEMVIVSGFNVYPREVEDALFTHPSVLEAAVVGVPDDYRGEVLAACVVVSDSKITPSELLSYLSSKLAKYKLPRDLRVVDALPKTSVGKPDKKQIKLDFYSVDGLIQTVSSPH